MVKPCYGALCCVPNCTKRKRKKQISDDSFVRSDSKGSSDEETPAKRNAPCTFHK